MVGLNNSFNENWRLDDTLAKLLMPNAFRWRFGEKSDKIFIYLFHYSANENQPVIVYKGNLTLIILIVLNIIVKLYVNIIIN